MVTPISTATGTLCPNWLLGQGLTGIGFGEWGKLMKKLYLWLFVLCSLHILGLAALYYWSLTLEGVMSTYERYVPVPEMQPYSRQ
jgi:hypothetical protein